MIVKSLLSGSIYEIINGDKIIKVYYTENSIKTGKIGQILISEYITLTEKQFEQILLEHL